MPDDLRRSTKNRNSPPAAINIAFGRVLQGVRNEKSLSQEELGFDSGYHRTYVSLLERGLKNPSLSAVFRLSKACLRRMLKERRGRIINIGSVVGSIGNAGQVHYAAAKAGLVGFTKALAKEVATRNITVNIVAPGFIETDMTRTLPTAQREAYLAQIPVGRFGAAEEVANAVLFLASREAGYITGQTLHVNGGMFMG